MVTISSSYNGPIDSGHGGVAAGRFAEFIDPRSASVRLHAPIPLDTPMQPIPGRDPSSIDVLAGTETIATVSPLSAALDVAPFHTTPTDLITEAERDWTMELTADHPCPTCFGCGHGRITDSGLGLCPGRVSSFGYHATRWSPNCDGDVPPWMIWAALDCPSGAPAIAAVGPEHMVLTGKLSVEIRRPVLGRDHYQIAGRLAEQDGRKLYTEAALVDHNGENLAVATATWISVRRPAELVAA